MKRININYKPLDKSVNLRVVSGSLVQQYNATAQEYVPDYTLVPLVIQPDVYFADPDGLIGSGLKNSSLTDIIWYENEVISSKAIVSSNTSYTIDTSATETRGRISIKKNIPEGQQLTLIFTAKFTDTRTGYPIPVNGSVLLCVAQAVEAATPRIVFSYPVGSRLYPTTGQRGLKIDCKLMAGDAELSPTWKWQLYSGSSYRDLTSADQVQGLDTSRLWVPAGLMSRQTKIKTIATLSGKTYTQEHIVGIAYERYDVDIIVPGNGEVTPDMTSVTVKAKVWNNRGVIDRPATYFKLEWLDQDNVKLGEGETLEIAKTKYASGSFGVNLKVSELYSGLVLGEKVWVLDLSGGGDVKYISSPVLENALQKSFSRLDDGGGNKITVVGNDNTIIFINYQNNTTKNIIITPNSILFTNESGPEVSESWMVLLDDTGLLKSSVNEIIYKWNVSKKDASGLVININGTDIGSEYFDASYFLYGIRGNFGLEIRGFQSDTKTVLSYLKLGLYDLQFDNMNLIATSTNSLIKDLPIAFSVIGGTASDVIKQIVI